MKDTLTKEQPSPPVDDEEYSPNQLIGAGIGIGAFGVISAVVLGATCPVCVVAAPALIGAGVVKRFRNKRSTCDDE